jgi:uncharacterized protein YeaC (DUF1315 family)
MDTEKKPRGRPLTEDVKNNRESYFSAYYHKHNHDIVCECGQHIKSGSMFKHKKSIKHIYLIEKKIENI